MLKALSEAKFANGRTGDHNAMMLRSPGGSKEIRNIYPESMRATCVGCRALVASLELGGEK
jgi:hypothetical protein